MDGAYFVFASEKKTIQCGDFKVQIVFTKTIYGVGYELEVLDNDWNKIPLKTLSYEEDGIIIINDCIEFNFFQIKQEAVNSYHRC